MCGDTIRSFNKEAVDDRNLFQEEEGAATGRRTLSLGGWEDAPSGNKNWRHGVWDYGAELKQVSAPPRGQIVHYVVPTQQQDVGCKNGEGTLQRESTHPLRAGITRARSEGCVFGGRIEGHLPTSWEGHKLESPFEIPSSTKGFASSVFPVSPIPPVRIASHHMSPSLITKPTAAPLYGSSPGLLPCDSPEESGRDGLKPLNNAEDDGSFFLLPEPTMGTTTKHQLPSSRVSAALSSGSSGDLQNFFLRNNNNSHYKSISLEQLKGSRHGEPELPRATPVSSILSGLASVTLEQHPKKTVEGLAMYYHGGDGEQQLLIKERESSYSTEEEKMAAMISKQQILPISGGPHSSAKKEQLAEMANDDEGSLLLRHHQKGSTEQGTDILLSPSQNDNNSNITNMPRSLASSGPPPGFC